MNEIKLQIPTLDHKTAANNFKSEFLEMQEPVIYGSAIRKHNNKIIGMIDIRHNLRNDFLKQYGGHIGYSVRPSERRKSYGMIKCEHTISILAQVRV